MAKTLREQIHKRRAFGDRAEEAFLQVVRTHAVLHGEVESLMRRHGVTSAGYNVLRILRGEGRPLPSLEVARRLVAKTPDITRLVNRLIEHGLVRRERDPDDGRVARLALTAAGRARLKKIDPEVAALHREQLGHLPDADLAALSRLLERAREPHEARNNAG